MPLQFHEISVTILCKTTGSLLRVLGEWVYQSTRGVALVTRTLSTLEQPSP